MKRRRAKPKLTWKRGYSEDPDFRLPEDSMRELIEIVSLEDDPGTAAAMVEEIRYVLSRYPSMARAVDQQPRPCHKLALLDPALGKPAQLAGLVLAWNNQDLLWDLTRHGLYFERAQEIARNVLSGDDQSAGVAELLQTANRVRTTLAAQESRHRRRRDARAAVIRELCSVFDFYDSTDHDFQYPDRDFRDRPKPQGVTEPAVVRGSRVDREQPRGLSRPALRAQFVATALSAAEIPHPELSLRTPSRCRFSRMLPPTLGGPRRAGQMRRLLRELTDPNSRVDKKELRTKLRELGAPRARLHRAWAAILRAAAALRVEQSLLTKEQAVTIVCEKRSDLYDAYQQAFRSQAS